MAEGLNRVMLIGNLGADPELKYTQNGQGVLRLRLADGMPIAVISKPASGQCSQWNECQPGPGP